MNEAISLIKKEMTEFWQDKFEAAKSQDSAELQRKKSEISFKYLKLSKKLDEFSTRFLKLGPVESAKVKTWNEERIDFREQQDKEMKQQVESYMKSIASSNQQRLDFNLLNFIPLELQMSIRRFDEILPAMIIPESAPSSPQDQALFDGIRLAQEGCQILGFVTDQSSANGAVRSLSNQSQKLNEIANKIETLASDNGQAKKKYSDSINAVMKLVNSLVSKTTQLAVSDAGTLEEIETFHAAAIQFSSSNFGGSQVTNSTQVKQTTPGSTDILSSLKQAGLSLQKNHNNESRFPTVLPMGQSVSGLSWRVHVLPYYGYEELHAQFHLDEPWDSPHNIKLLDKIPDYLAIGTAPGSGKTRIHAFCGENSLLSQEKPRYASCTDGTSRVLSLIFTDSDKATEWTKPGGIAFNSNDVTGSLGQPIRGKYFVVFFSGQVGTLSDQAPAEVIEELIDPDDSSTSLKFAPYVTYLK
ncbi:DUF1559 family PulG-like putative transporter [Rubinisphaera italica]|nr:DUF1559 domain-containing protein [Rubinisphaera italica]